MIHKLVYNKEDPNYILLHEIIDIVDSRKTKMIMARNGFKKINDKLNSIKIVIISIFFENDLSYTVDQLKDNEELKNAFNIDEIPNIDNMYNKMSNLDVDSLEKTVNSILNSFIKRKPGQRKRFIIDATPADLNINHRSKKISKKSLEGKDFAWGWGTAIGYYIGYKVTLVLDHETKMPVYFMIERGSPSDSKMIPKILPELIKKRIIKKGDYIYYDRGYYSYENYNFALRKYQIVSLILPKKDYNKGKLEEVLSYPLDTYKLSKKEQNKAKKQYERLVKELLESLDKPKRIKYNRGFIEDFFKIMKINLGFKNLNKFTLNSIRKHTALTVLIAGLIVHLRIKTKADFQKFSEGKMI